MLTPLPPRDERGFTLIELMVVVLIIAILIAIAIPTFLGAQDRARDRSAQSNLRNSITAAKTIATDNGGLFLNPDGDPLGAGDMPELEPAIVFDETTATVDEVLILTEATGAYVTFVAQSASSRFFGISVDRDGAVLYCSSPTTQDDCDDRVADAANYGDSW